MSKAQNGGNVMERLAYRDKDGFPMMKNVVDSNREALSASPPTKTRS